MASRELRFVAGFLTSILFLVPAYALENAGLKQNIGIETGGYDFEVSITANFRVTGHEFVAEEKRLTLFIDSATEANLIELLIPTNLINGNFTFHLNGLEILPRVHTNDVRSFITAEFPGSGSHRLDIVGTTYLPEFETSLLILTASLSGLVILRGRGMKRLFVD